MAVYLDHNATTPMRPQAIEAMVEVMRVVGNASSVHGFGRTARGRVDRARQQVASLVGGNAANVIFTSGGTEANNLALRGCGRARVLVSAIEHDSVLTPVEQAERIPVHANGVVDLDALQRMLAASTEPAIVAVMLANNETGVIQPVAEVVRIARRHGALVACDAVQAGGKIAVDMGALGVDYLSLSAHKLGGPQGVGALVLREGAPLTAVQTGGGQERGRRGGTENVAGVVGFGAAAQGALSELDRFARLADLRDRVQSALAGARVVGADAPRLPNTLNVAMTGVPAQTQIMALDLAGIAISAGSACSSGKVKFSPVLHAMGVDERDAGSALRISFGWNSSEEDAARMIAAWMDVYRRLSSPSPRERERERTAA
jgi:cysteine desulfurase